MKARLTIFMVLLTLAGCGKRQAAEKPPAQPDAEPVNSRPSESDPPTSIRAAGEDSPAAAQQPDSPATEPLAPTAAVRPPAERVVVFTEATPILIDFRFVVGDQPLRERFAALIERVRQQADTDEDGVATWDELSKVPRFVYGVPGNAPFPSERERIDMIRLYDSNRNQVVDLDEIPRFLTRNAGGGQPFSLTESNYYRGYNRSNSGIRAALDTSGDGILTPDEWDAAIESISSRDLNLDELITLGEVATSGRDDMPVGQLPTVRRTGAGIAHFVRPSTRWSQMFYEIQEHYAFGGRLQNDQLDWLPELVETLDQDADQRLSVKELTAIATIPPHLEVDVQFGDSMGQWTTELEAASVMPHVADALSLDVDTFQVVVSLPGDGQLTIFINDTLTTSTAGYQTQFERADQDGNLYLDEEELAATGIVQVGGFRAIDADDDGKIVIDELISYTAEQQSVLASQIRARVADGPDVLFPLLDADQDRRLEPRELRTAGERIARLDRDGDNRVGHDELPGAIYLGIARGNPQMLNELFVLPKRTNGVPATLPPWFERMDRNGDGELSRREFLGNRDQFATMDRNEDGFIEASEVDE